MKNILVLFLSTVKVKEDGKVDEANYNDVGITYTTNESAFKYLNNYLKETGGDIDYIFIFASQTVKDKNMTYKIKNNITNRDEIKEWKNEDGNSETHLDYFKKRVIKEYDITQEKMIVIDYDETASPDDMTPLLKSIKNINEVAISGTDEVTIHVDMTGGMRHISMLMVALMRLLQFRGYEIGKVMYSNYHKKQVEESNEIYNIFDLVNGASEFTNYGSATEFLKYKKRFKGKISDELDEMITNIENFSKEIKLCHLGELLKVNGDLATSIKTFDDKIEQELNQNDKLVKVIMPVIHDKYDSILKDPTNKLDLIEWCVKNEYIQQALTFYNETIPKVIMRKGILDVVEIKKREMKKKYDDDRKTMSGKIEYEYYVINRCNPKNPETEKDKLRKDMVDIIRRFFNECSDDHSFNLDDIKTLENASQHYFDKYKGKLKKTMTSLVSNEFPNNDTVVNLMGADDAKHCDKIRFYERVKGLADKDVLSVFKINIDKLYKPIQQSKRINTVLRMYQQKILESYLSTEQIKAVLEDYFWLQDERNGANHARNNGKVASLDEIKAKFDKSINDLRKYCKDIEEKRRKIMEKKIEIWKGMPRNNSDELAAVDEYFDNELMPLAAKLFISTQESTKKYYGMILTLGTSWQPLALSIMALQPEEILFLCTEDTKKLIPKLVDFAKVTKNKYVVKTVNRSDVKTIYEAMAESYKEWIIKGNVCVDITGGTKAMASGAAMFGAVTGMDIYYVESKYLPLYRRPEPGSETLKQLENPQEFMKKIGG